MMAPWSLLVLLSLPARAQEVCTWPSFQSTVRGSCVKLSWKCPQGTPEDASLAAGLGLADLQNPEKGDWKAVYQLQFATGAPPSWFYADIFAMQYKAATPTWMGARLFLSSEVGENSTQSLTPEVYCEKSSTTKDGAPEYLLLTTVEYTPSSVTLRPVRYRCLPIRPSRARLDPDAFPCVELVYPNAPAVARPAPGSKPALDLTSGVRPTRPYATAGWFTLAAGLTSIAASTTVNVALRDDFPSMAAWNTVRVWNVAGWLALPVGATLVMWPGEGR